MKNSKSNECRQEKNGGHVERIADDRLPKRAAELREDGRRRRGRPSLIWEDCVKRDVKR